MDDQATQHKTPRGSKPSWVDESSFGLIKACSELRATYQIRLLLFMAMRDQKQLVLQVPKKCKLRKDLKALKKQHSKILKINRSKS